MTTTCDTWPVTWACDVSCLSPAVTGLAVEIASELLEALSGHQFGTCTATIRPCRSICTEWGPLRIGWGAGFESMYPFPYLYAGKWYNLGCGTCGDSCSCTELSEVILPGNVVSILSIKMDGTPMVTGSYRVDNGNRLLRTDGGRWPVCQNMSQPDTAAGTWSITGVFGQPVPSGGSLAVGELACELSKALAGDNTCRLPRGVTQVSRQGVTINYAKVTDALKEGLTGLYLVDLFLHTFNPHHLVAPAHVYNVDAPLQREQTWP